MISVTASHPLLWQILGIVLLYFAEQGNKGFADILLRESLRRQIGPHHDLVAFVGVPSVIASAEPVLF